MWSAQGADPVLPARKLGRWRHCATGALVVRMVARDELTRTEGSIGWRNYSKAAFDSSCPRPSSSMLRSSSAAAGYLWWPMAISAGR